MKTILIAASCALALAASAAKPVTIDVKPGKGDMTRTIQKAIDRAAARSAKGDADVTLRIAPGVYNISRTQATPVLYYVSNTTTEYENKDNTKHIGLYFKNIDNLTVEAEGARFITHGEMTSWAVESCRNLTLKGFTVDAADPSVPEMTVIAVTDSTFTARVHPSSRYRIEGGKLHWVGEGWDFTDGIAQVYDPHMKTTLRCGSPVADSREVKEAGPGELEFIYAGKRPADARVGVTYQMRHSFRTEVAGFINRSKDVTLRGVTMNFLGNFGIVAQFSENVTYDGVNCVPDPASGRTCAGFADFMQVSGCRGLVSIRNCHFAGAHDDPINVHGTHLRVVGQPSADKLTVRFMHGQTRGFDAFNAGDTVALVNDATLLPVGKEMRVREARLLNEYDMELTFDAPVELPSHGRYVLENLTWTPAVEILDNTFTLTPTRGILITTCRPVVIARNRFDNIPMASILVADDARSWYESGPVRNLTIRDNVFTNCSAPQIWIAPENSVTVPGQKVHSNITIEGNRFECKAPYKAIPAQIKARSLDGLTLRSNTVQPGLNSSLILEDCSNVSVDSF